MRNTYRFLKKSLAIILICLLAVVIFSVICFAFMYDADRYALRFPHVVTIMLYLFVVGTIAYSIFVCVKAKSINVTHIKKNNKLLQFASMLTAIMMLIFFIYECVVSITRANFQLYFFFRVTRWLLSLPACLYFAFQAIPKKIHRTKIVVPTWAKVTMSICSIAWCVFGILTTYFSSLPTTDIAKITQLIVYASLALFLVFEGEFQNAKQRHKPYMISAFICTTLTFAFPLGISVAKIIGKMSPYRAFSQPELLLSVAIGVYALAKMSALVSTMHTVIESSNTGGHSSKFDKKPATVKADVVEEDGKSDENTDK